MSLSNEARLLYLKTSFKNINESKAEDFYKVRAETLGHSFKPVNDENETKRGRWFYLLRGINSCIQFDNLPIEDQEKLYNDWKAHPYFAYDENKELTVNLFQNRKIFKEILTGVEPGVARIFYGLYHLNVEAKAIAMKEIKEMAVIPEKCSKLSNVIILFKQKLPVVYAEYSEMFQAISHKGLGDPIVSLQNQFIAFLKKIPWYGYLAIAYFIFVIINIIIEDANK
jgi:hypothetical protein